MKRDDIKFMHTYSTLIGKLKYQEIYIFFPLKTENIRKMIMYKKFQLQSHANVSADWRFLVVIDHSKGMGCGLIGHTPTTFLSINPIHFRIKIIKYGQFWAGSSD